MTKEVHTRKIDTLFVLVVFCVFAGSVLAVLMLSGSIYKNIVDLSNKDYDARTSLSYVWSKAKNADSLDRLHAGEYNGVPALFVDEEYWGDVYHTVIYAYDGWVMELFCEASRDFPLEDGTRVIAAETLTFETLEGGSILVTSDIGSLLLSTRTESGSIKGGVGQ